MFALLRRLGLCRHRAMYREHRELDGRDVMFFVCDDCGHAVPALKRTPDEYLDIVAKRSPARPGRV